MDANEVRDLVRAAAAGDSRGWYGLIERFGELVWSITRAYGLSPADGADVAQTTWLRLAERLHRPLPGDGLGVWLATVARQECLRLLQVAGRTPPAGVDSAATPAGPRPPAAVGPAWERDALLWRVVRELPERCRRLLRILMATPPPSHAEVAAALGLPVGSIGPERARCLRDFRQRMATVGITADIGDS